MKECGTCSVSHWFPCQATVILVCHDRGKGCISYPDKMWNTGQIVEFFSVFVRLVKCLSSQENYYSHILRLYGIPQ